MRFLMLNWRDLKNPKAGGAERVTYAFLRGLVERNHEVFWYSNGFAGAVPEEIIDGIQIIRGGGKGTSVVKAIRWYRHQKPFDLVIDQHHGIARARIGLGVPAVVEEVAEGALRSAVDELQGEDLDRVGDEDLEADFLELQQATQALVCR